MTFRTPLKQGSWDGVLLINAINMRTPCWSVLDYSPLWLGADRRGSDAPVLNLVGLRPYAPLDTETRYDLDLVVSGFHTQAGVLASDPWAQFYSTLQYLRDNVIDTPANAQGTYDCAYTPPGVATASRKLRCLPLVIAEDPNMPVKRYTLTLEVIGGAFV